MSLLELGIKAREVTLISFLAMGLEKKSKSLVL